MPRGRPPKTSTEETPTERMTLFTWQLARPDSRQYRQQSTELEPQEIVVGVEIPREYWYDDEMTILTPKGMRYALDCLGSELLDTKVEPEVSDDDWVGSTDDEWTEKESTENSNDDWTSDEDEPPWEVDEESDEDFDVDNEDNWEA